MMKSYTTEQTNADVLTVRMDSVKAGWEQWFLLMSDVHWDNPHCDRGLFHKHLRQARERGAGVFILGDFFCAMGGRFDKRANKELLRPEHQVSNYFDALTDTATDDLSPYAEILEQITPGNHETAILKHNETDLTARLCKALGVRQGGYAGYVRFMFSRGDSGRTSKTLFYHHGWGGGGPVTKGVIDTNRLAVWQPDADICVLGHIHESYYLEIERQRLSDSGQVYLEAQRHLRTATYKNEHNLAGGWHIERGAAPKPLGGWWIKFFHDSSKRDNIGIQAVRAD